MSSQVKTITSKAKQSTIKTNTPLDRVVLLSLNLSSFRISRRGDKSQITTDSDIDSLHLSKEIIQSKELAKISNLDTQITAVVNWKINQRTMPFPFKAGIYMIPIDYLEEILTRLEVLKKKRSELIEEFIDAYPRLIQEAQVRLKSQFDQKDYPDVKNIVNCFDMNWQVLMLQTPENLKALRKNLYDEEKEKAKQLWNDAVKDVNTLLRSEAKQFLKDIIEKLVRKGKEEKHDDNGEIKKEINKLQSRSDELAQLMAGALEEGSNMLVGYQQEWRNIKEQIIYLKAGLKSKPEEKEERGKVLTGIYLERFQDFFKTLEARDISEDQELREVISITKMALERDGKPIDYAKLKNDDELRKAVAKDFQEAANVLDALGE